MSDPHHQTHLKAIRIMLQAAVSFSFMAICVKWVSQSLPSLEVVFFRSLIGMFIILGIITVKRVPLFGKETGLMIMRGVSGFCALALHFYTIAKLPLGTAVLLNYTSPIFSVILAVFFLKERPSLMLVVMILVSFSGIFLIGDTSFTGWNLEIFLGLLSAVFTAVAFISIRALKHKESPYTVIFYFTAISSLCAGCFMPFIGFRWPDAHEWLLLIGIGIGTFYGQLWMTISLSMAPTALVSPFIYLTPLLSYIYGLIFFGDKLTAMSFVGAFLIILGGSLISYFEAKANRPAISDKR